MRTARSSQGKAEEENMEELAAKEDKEKRERNEEEKEKDDEDQEFDNH